MTLHYEMSPEDFREEGTGSPSEGESGGGEPGTGSPGGDASRQPDPGTGSPESAAEEKQAGAEKPADEAAQPEAGGGEAPAGEKPADEKGEVSAEAGGAAEDSGKLTDLLNTTFNSLLAGVGQPAPEESDKALWHQRVPDPTIEERDGKWVVAYKLPRSDGTGFEDVVLSYDERPPENLVRSAFGAELKARRAELDAAEAKAAEPAKPVLPERDGGLSLADSGLALDLFGGHAPGDRASPAEGEKKPVGLAQQWEKDAASEIFFRDEWPKIVQEIQQRLENNEELSPEAQKAIADRHRESFRTDRAASQQIEVSVMLRKVKERERWHGWAQEAAAELGEDSVPILREFLSVLESQITGAPPRSRLQAAMNRAMSNPAIAMVHLARALDMPAKIAAAERAAYEKAHKAFGDAIAGGATKAEAKAEAEAAAQEAVVRAIETNAGAAAGVTPGTGIRPSPSETKADDKITPMQMDDFHNRLYQTNLGPPQQQQ